MPEKPDNIVPITPDARTAAEQFSADHNRELLTILFTDLVDSTKLQQDAGNVEAARLTELHRKIVRDELAKYDAREIEWAGDSCLAVFTKPSDAVVFALRMQAEHRRVREAEPKLPLVRLGMHLGEVVVKRGEKKDDLFGLQVSEAARVMSVARGNQIFCTRAVFDNARGALKGRAVEGVGEAVWVNYGAYLLKGSDEPVELCEIGSADVAVLKAPEANDKVAPVMPGGVEAMRALIPYEEGVEASDSGVSRRLFAIVALLIAVGGILAGRFLINFGTTGRVADSDSKIQSLAVLPFENLTGDAEKEYFVDGMTDTLTAELSKIESIKVIARTSAMRFKNTDESLSSIARALDVDGLIEGSVQQMGDEIRITAQLVHGASEEHLWGENFEGTLTGVMKLQGEVAVSIADQIGAVLTPEERDEYASAKDVNPKAYDLYLQGRSVMQSRLEEDLRAAIETFEESVRLDSEFALPHSGLSDVYGIMAILGIASKSEVKDKAFEHARRAVELDRSQAEGHASLGWAYTEFDVDRNWATAERAFQRAIELNPGLSRGRRWYSVLLVRLGRNSDAVREAQRAFEVDPLDPLTLMSLGNALTNAGRYDEAEDILRQGAEMAPSLNGIFMQLRFLYTKLGRHEDALDAARKTYDVTNSDRDEWDVLFLEAGLEGADALRTLVAEVERGEHDDRFPRRGFGKPQLYFAVGDSENALKCLEENIQAGTWSALITRNTYSDRFIEADPSFPRYLHDDPRFWELLDTYDLPPLPPEHTRYENEQAYLRQKAAEAALAAQPKPVTRFTITSPVDIVAGPVLSPDGSRLVFVGRDDGTKMLYERRLDADDTAIRALEGTENADPPYFSPDSESIAFSRDRRLYSMRLSTGVVSTITDVETEFERSGTWNSDGMIVQPVRDSGLMLVNSITGEAETIADMSASQTVYRHHGPRFLPGGDRILFTAVSAGEDTATTEILSIADRTRQQLFMGGEFAQYTSTGHIVYSLANGIWAVPFEIETRTLNGAPQHIFGPLNDTDANGDVSAFSFSASGHLAFWPGRIRNHSDRYLIWIDRDGAEQFVVPDADEYLFPNLSPDGRKLAVSVGVRGNNRTWIFDLERKTSFPLNALHPNNAMPTWSPQGDWIAYVGGGRDLYRIRPTPDAQPEVVIDGPGFYNPSSWSPDGSELVATFYLGIEPTEIIGIDIETGESRSLVDTPRGDALGRVSPNGDWLAYTTKVSGRLEVWVQPYPSAAPGTAVALTSDGGNDPKWSPDGTKLLYIRSDGQSMGVIDSPDADNANWGLPRKYMDLPFVPVVASVPVPAYDIAPDGRLVTVKRVEGSADSSAETAREIRVVLNAFEEIKRLAPVPEAN